MYGEREAVEALKRRLQDEPDGDDFTKWATAQLIDIASGIKSHKYVGAKLMALRDILDRRQGRPTEQVRHTGEIRHRVEIVDDADGEG